MKQSLIMLMLPIFVLAVGAVSPRRAQRHYTKTSVCQVFNLGTANRVLNVEIKAAVMGDRMHGAFLIDAKCPGKALKLGVSLPNAAPSVSEFDRVYWSDGAPGFRGRTLSGTFFGKLRIGGVLPLNPKHREISIDLMSVENLSDARAPEKPQ